MLEGDWVGFRAPSPPLLSAERLLGRPDFELLLQTTVYDGALLGELHVSRSGNDAQPSGDATDAVMAKIAQGIPHVLRAKLETDNALSGTLTLDGTLEATGESVTWSLPLGLRRESAESGSAPHVASGLCSSQPAPVVPSATEGSTAPPPCDAFSLLLLDGHSALVTFYFKGSVPPFAFTLTRRAEKENTSWRSTAGTIALLLIVVAVKFGPKYYYRWRYGINTDKLWKRPSHGEDKLTNEQRAALDKKQEEILSQMRAEDEQTREREKNRFTKKE